MIKKKHIIYIEDNNGKYDSFLQYADDEKNYLSSHLLKSIKHHIFSHSRFHGNEVRIKTESHD